MGWGGARPAPNRPIPPCSQQPHPPPPQPHMARRNRHQLRVSRRARHKTLHLLLLGSQSNPHLQIRLRRRRSGVSLVVHGRVGSFRPWAVWWLALRLRVGVGPPWVMPCDASCAGRAQAILGIMPPFRRPRRVGGWSSSSVDFVSCPHWIVIRYSIEYVTLTWHPAGYGDYGCEERHS